MPGEAVIYTSCTYFRCSKMHTFFKSKMLLETGLGSLVCSYQILTDTGGICPWFVNFSLNLKTIFWVIPKSSSSTGVPKPQTPLFRIWPCKWLAGSCTTQLGQAAAQWALTCVHNSLLLAQVELHTCMSACHSHKDCMCASLPLAQPCSPFLVPQLSQQAEKVGHCCANII